MTERILLTPPGYWVLVEMCASSTGRLGSLIRTHHGIHKTLVSARSSAGVCLSHSSCHGSGKPFVKENRIMSPQHPVDLEILTVAVHPRIGGMTSWIDSLAHGLTALGWSVRLVGISEEWSSDYNDAPFEALHVPMPAPRRGMLEPLDKWKRWQDARHSLLRWNREQPPPRMRLSDSTPGILRTARVLSGYDQAPWVVLAGGNIFNETTGHPWSSLLHRAIRTDMNQAARIFVDGPDLSLSLAEHGIPAERIEVQYHGVDTSAFGGGKETALHFFPESSMGPRLVWHGRLADTGGPLRFIGIAKELPGCLPRMCGDGPQRGGVLEQLAGLGHPEWYVGSLSKNGVAALLGEAEYGVYPLREMAGIPRVLLEAMAAGLAVVTWETGACRELITDGRDGFIRHDEAGMLEVLKQLKDDPGLVQQIGAKARETILQSWTEEATLRAFAKKLKGWMAR